MKKEYYIAIVVVLVLVLLFAMAKPKTTTVVSAVSPNTANQTLLPSSELPANAVIGDTFFANGVTYTYTAAGWVNIGS